MQAGPDSDGSQPSRSIIAGVVMMGAVMPDGRRLLFWRASSAGSGSEIAVVDVTRRDLVMGLRFPA